MTARLPFGKGIQNLQNLLASLFIPQETALLANYPNPFNPETWIPYQLAAPAEVSAHDLRHERGGSSAFGDRASSGGHCTRAETVRHIGTVAMGVASQSPVVCIFTR